MNTTLQSMRVGLFFILGLALIYIIYEALNTNKITRKPGYTITATFDDLKQVSTGDPVRMAGVEIGSVESTRLQKGRASALLFIAEQYQIPQDSVATIMVRGLLGTNYISIRYGHPEVGYLIPGAAIGSEESPDFNSILNQVGRFGEKLEKFTDRLTGEESIDISGGLFEKLSNLVDENREKIDRVLTNLDTVSGKLASGEGTLGKLLRADKAYDELLVTVEEIKMAASNASTTLDQAQEVIAKVRDGEGTLGKLLSSDEMASGLEETVSNVRLFSEKLNSGEGTLGRLIEDDSLYLELQAFLQKADRALESVGDSGPITAVGVAARAFF